MENPWVNIPDNPPYCLPSECETINYHNTNCKPINKIHTNALPEPFIGDLKKAKVVLLQLNPGWEEEDPIAHHDMDYNATIRNNLKQKNLDTYPLYALNPKYKHTGNARYWNKRLKELVIQAGLKNVAEKLVILEYFPYHSKRYHEFPKKLLFHFKMKDLTPSRYLHSQLYNFHLLREYLENEKTMIIALRAGKRWMNAMKTVYNLDQETCDRLISGNINPRNPYINAKSLGDGFEEIVSKLTA